MAESRLHAAIGSLYIAATEPHARRVLDQHERKRLRLVSGSDVSAIALERGVSIATVRSQVWGGLETTDARNLRELVLRLANLPSRA